MNYLYGNTGNDILYGSVMSDELFGDWASTDGVTDGGDDIIYTGVAA